MPGNETVELTVESIGVRGDGIALFAGERVFLPLTAPGDRVRARLGARRGEGRQAQILEFLAQGERAAPRCPHYGACGGCALQHLPEQAYVEAKDSWLRAALRQHGLGDEKVLPLRLLPPGTRRRARFALRRARQGGGVEIGFHARASHDVVDMHACAVLHPALVALLAPLRRLAKSLLPAGGRSAATVTLAETRIDLLLDLDAPPALAGLEALADFAAAQDLARLAWRAPRDGAVPVALRRPVRMVFGGIAVDLPEDVFLQASADSDAALTATVLDGVGAARRVADLYAGIGTFAFPLARNAAVHAAEFSAPALGALRAAAARAGLAGRVTAERRDLDERPLGLDELAPFDAVVFDPPRAGARAQSAALAASAVPRVVAVSCNPATFARDAKILVDGGYELRSIQPIDSFVWSPHLELVGCFTRSPSGSS